MFDGHAAAGVWLTKRTFGNAIETDQMEVRKALASHELIVFETTGVTHRPAMTLEAAQQALEPRLAEEEAHRFVAAIGVRRARSGGITPLASHEPLRRTVPEEDTRPVADLPLPTHRHSVSCRRKWLSRSRPRLPVASTGGRRSCST